MAISGFMFLAVRLFELVITVPIVGLLGWFVDTYNDNNQLTPNYILVLFIVSCLALGWIFFTIVGYLRARHDAIAVSFFDLCFVGAFIAGVVVLRGIADADCTDVNAGITTSGSYFDLDVDRTCAMLKASFALGIIDILAFFVSMLLALLVWRNHRNDDRVVVKHHSSRHGHRRSGSRSRSSRDYDYRPRGSSRSQHNRRHYYV